MNKDNKDNKEKINRQLIKESLIDYNNLEKQLKENVAESVKAMLDEEVRKTYAAILNESEDDEEEQAYEVEEVDDTTEPETEEPEDTTAGTEEPAEAGDEEGTEPEVDTEAETEETVLNDDATEGETEEEADFEKYKVGDNEYDFRNANDDEIVKIYKKLTDDDQVTVVKDGDKVKVSDKETGADYIIELGGDDEPSEELTDINLTDDMDMNESVVYEVVLNEYDSHVGYTDNYQKKDVMTSDGVNEPSKHGRDIDKGVPHTAEKPWSNKKDGAPFNHKKAKTVECGTQNSTEPELDETVAQKGGTNRAMGVKSHIPNTSCTNNPKKHVASVAGEYKGSNATNESITKKANKILEDYKKVKEQLNKVTGMLKEAAVTNVNLGGIIKLISENATTKEEKRDIINRFTNEVHTIEESRSLYNTISAELNKKPKATANINEEQQFGSGNQEVISESKLYQDESLMNSLGLMHKICK